MSDSDRIEEIREEKRQRLLSEQGGGTADDAASEASATAPDEPATTAPDEPIHVGSAEEFSDVTERYDVVFTDFYADWCGPCKQLEPIVEQLAAQTDAAVAKVDIDANQRLAAQFGVRSVPTMILFSDGEPAEQVVGVRGADQLAGLIQQYT
ncbi:MAG: thioredoxin [Halobaculum sp.]